MAFLYVHLCEHYIYGIPARACVQTLLENEKGNMGLSCYTFKIILKLHSILRIPGKLPFHRKPYITGYSTLLSTQK